ncbi:DUF3782 domain-containing protein [Spirosoma foliorum]|uniref:DUF3782 domain-containing protein n=1 Tax=Spirosoma foliorum TaxID=2710596 RepID=A0A7G5H490_9BACT|nr:DUF3782 domain-containing protein [Spirosoma foliorum]QMW05932.1 DUF3782 domain-containing protein [Spirosoma foliorum]
MESTTSFDEIKKILTRTAELTERNAKLIGDLGNKFGSFTEGMAFPAMEKVLRERFGMTTVTTRYKTQKGSDTIEIDVLGIANGAVNTVVVVEVKSHLKRRDIEQLLKVLDRFADYFPEQKGKKLYGILAFVDASDNVIQEAEKSGLYVARIHDELFDLLPLNGFLPKDFSQVTLKQ